MYVLICVITYQRPDELKRLLHSLGSLAFKKCNKPDIGIVVVDNDPRKSAYEVIQKICLEENLTLAYHHEMNRGIPQARNKALSVVPEKANFVVFVDDDEVVDKFWLDELLSAQHQYDASVVCGPVLPKFYVEAPKWIINGKFFERPRFLTGTKFEYAATNNVLVKRDVFLKMDKLFDEKLALTGGSDKEFFRRVSNAGFSIIWANDALVYEWVLEERINEKWILQRAYRLGNTDGLCTTCSNSSLQEKSTLFIKGMGRIILGLISIPISILFGKHIFIKVLRSVVRGIGTIAGLMNISYEEYRNAGDNSKKKSR